MQKQFTLILILFCSIKTFAWDYEDVTIGNLNYNLDAVKHVAEVSPSFDQSGEVVIPESVSYNGVVYKVTSIGKDAFSYNSNITTIVIPKTVTSAEEGTFFRCGNVMSIYVAHNNPSFSSIDGVLFSKNKKNLISYPRGKKGAYAIPNSVTSIETGAFLRCEGLTSVTIPRSVSVIGLGCFYECKNLTSVNFSNGVTKIEDASFYGCENLSSVKIPNSVTHIGERTFFGCRSLYSITIPNSVIEIGENVFEQCDNLASINVDSGNPKYCSIDGVLFSKDKTLLICYPCNKKGAYVIPNGVTRTERSAFNNCRHLTSLTIPNSVIDVGGIEGCENLTSINVDAENLYYSSIDGVLFNKGNMYLICYPNSKGGAYVVPNSVVNIGYYAFENCTQLTSVTIPNSVTDIYEGAFFNCPKLQEIIVPHGEIDRFMKMEGLEGMEDFVLDHVAEQTPDMVRNQINKGRVKTLVVTDDESGDSWDQVYFLRDGAENFLATFRYPRILFDNSQRLTYRMGFGPENEGKYTYNIDTILYEGNSCRPMCIINYESVDNIDASKTKSKDFRLYNSFYYSDNAVEPSAVLTFDVYNGNVICEYCTYSYTDFDEYGNWTKMAYSVYMEDEDQSIKDLYKQLSNFKLNIKQRKQIESKVIDHFRKLSKDGPIFVFTFTRDIEYY